MGIIRLTPQAENVVNEAASDPSEVGAPAVTPAMIEAGVSALYDSGAIEHPILGNDRELVRQIFLRMENSK
jgi:hypothetical protein